MNEWMRYTCYLEPVCYAAANQYKIRAQESAYNEFTTRCKEKHSLYNSWSPILPGSPCTTVHKWGCRCYLEPVYGAAVDERGVLSQPVPECISDRTEGDDYVQILTTSSDEIRQRCQQRKLCTDVSFEDCRSHQLEYMVQWKICTSLNQAA